ncbi:TonB-dependent receptor [Chryseobacterium polytrichastri]|uniref:Outer membrane receptor proteins, mostly Fe transport n=1 Tax=Chryseobacterium polytrichastri TaxID=1302687 RepID=A0A1M6Q378_9FLAO|nr:TonB-dependent receptor [Chryseobacterium polytrichastri]SHK14640.1 Outer membrane receptor proteins, mostly Fe transport [Chryseobacterium polytrichastri]
MRKKTVNLSTVGFLLFSSFALAQEDSLVVKDSTKMQKKDLKVGDNRNVMLNASSNSGPREVNIGLPSNIGGMTILENDLPVVYFSWPEMPNQVWRPSVSLEKTDLLRMDQLANTMGDLGFAVNSYTQTGTKELKGKGKFTTNNYGWIQGDVNVSGPISKNGWAYTAGIFANYDPGTYKLGFARNVDETKIVRAGITKFFNIDRGKISVLYKYSHAYSIDNYAVFRYGENGEVTELDNFTIGKDSFVVRDGMVKFRNNLTGEYYWTRLAGNDNVTKSHNVDVVGNYLLNNGWNFKFSTRFHFAKAATVTLTPISIFDVQESDGYKLGNNGQPYTGSVAAQFAMHTPSTPVTNIAGRFSLNKQVGNHNLTVGLLEQFYKVNRFTSNRDFFFQTVERQPQRLVSPGTDSDGFYNYNAGTAYHSGIENKLSVYASDEWKVSDNFSLHYGLNLRYQLLDGEFSLAPRHADFVFQPGDFSNFKNNWFHIGGSLNAKYNINKNFGLFANFLYTEENRRLESYSQALVPNTSKIKSPLGAIGVFWNTDYIQLLSQATVVKKNNYLARFSLVNPSNTTQAELLTLYYDIQTLGWTTDFVVKPFKGFNLHYLLTFQNPVYKNFNFTAFGKDYDYNNNNVLGIAKVLMEVDPSYTIDKWKFWASFRYFSKQYANLTNVLYFAPRWETFGGINYTFNKNLDVGGTVINFLNQRGASGSINGAELITDASPYYGKLLTGNYIMPLTFQFSVNFNF